MLQLAPAVGALDPADILHVKFLLVIIIKAKFMGLLT